MYNTKDFFFLVRVGFNLAKQKEYSKVKPLVVVLSEGEHGVEGSWMDSDGDVLENTLDITCSNITFIGQSKDKTTVHGAFRVLNRKNVTVKSLTLTIQNGIGLDVEGEEASVEMMDVSVKKCGSRGLYVRSGASVKATQCEFSANRSSGVFVSGGSKGIFTDCTIHSNGWPFVVAGVAVCEGSKGIFTDCTIHHNGWHGVVAANEGTLVELRGEKTEIHHNDNIGLLAISNAIINIYIPSRSITALVHDNGEDLNTDGGKIQSQLSSSSLELTVIHQYSLFFHQ